MRQLAIIGCSLLSVIVLVIVIIHVVTWYRSQQYKDTAVPYINNAIPELSKWDPDAIKGYMAPKVLEQTTEVRFAKIIEHFSKLGNLRSFEEPAFSNVYTGTNSEEGTQTVISYTVDAVYEKGDAVITMSLLELENSFKIYKFHISSMALLE